MDLFIKFIWFNNNINIKIMNESPLSYHQGKQVYITPSRKPTPHHCNADKKQNQFVNISQV